MADLEVLDLEERTGETGVTRNFCLVGKVAQNKSLAAPIIQNILMAAWKTRAPFHVVDWNNNVFLFQFENEEDKRDVYLESPWSITNSLLNLQPLKEGMTVSEVDFSTCPMWVQIHGLPVEKMTRANAEIIGKRLGRLLALETASDNFLLARSFLRVRVEVNINQALVKGFWLKGKADSSRDRWISYKYERLPDFCYACGRIGHDKKGCRFTPRGEDALSGYGPELRTGRPRKGVIPIEVIRFEVDEAEKRVNEILHRRPVLDNRDLGSTDNLLRRRRPEPQSSSSETRGKEVMRERVMPRTEGQRQHLPGVGEPNPLATRVTMTGNAYSSPLLSSHQGILDIVASDSRISVVGSESDHTPITHLAVGVSEPILEDNPNPNTMQAPTQYFVTEPDSPKGDSSSPNFVQIPPLSLSPTLPSNLNPSKTNPQTSSHIPYQVHLSPTITKPKPLTLSSPNNTNTTTSPLKLTPPNTPVLSLSTVFDSLTIKRKAQDEFSDYKKSKILRLCSPDPNPPSTQSKLTHPTRKKPNRTRISKTSTREISTAGNLVINDQGLCEVQIQ